MPVQRSEQSKENKRQYMRNYMKGRLADPEFREQQDRYKQEWRERNTKEVDRLFVEFRKNGCLVCPEKEPPCLDAHHTNPDKKEFAPSSGNQSAKRVARELAKCVCVCANCHRKHHAGIIEILAPTVG